MSTRSLVPKGGNDCVATPLPLAIQIVQHFRPTGRVLEPCRGADSPGPFEQALRTIGVECHWAEILAGRDFLTMHLLHYDWIITNPPWSQFRKFLVRSMQVADNIVFLSTINHWFLTGRRRDMREAGFGIVEILELQHPPKPWPSSGFSLAAVWIRRGWTGGATFTK